MVITVCDLIEKFECAGKFTLCGHNVTRKYWLISDRPNKAKKMWPFFAPCPDLMGGHGPLLPSSYTPAYEDSKIITFEQKHIRIGIHWELIGQNEIYPYLKFLAEVISIAS